MCSNVLKKVSLQFYSNYFSLKQLSKSFITKALKYKAVSKFKNNLYYTLLRIS